MRRHRLGVGGVDAAAQGGEGHRPVHGPGVEVVEAEARGQRRATVDLPDPAGPSMAMTLTSGGPYAARSAGPAARRAARQ